MKSNQYLLWALGVNGEGSARVTFAFIQNLFTEKSLIRSHTTILYTSDSTLDQLISSYLQSQPSSVPIQNVRFIRLPKIARNYILHFTLKFFIGPFFTYQSVVVFDDYPFRFLSNQVLYFHQPNLVYNSSILWRIKRLTFRILLSRSIAVYFQTKHMRDSFVHKFGLVNTICFLHDLN